MLAASVREFTRPIYSSICFGLFPDGAMRVGACISVGNRFLLQPAYLSSPGLPISDLPEAGGHRYTGIFAETRMTARDEFDPLAPQREAAFFYGLFLRGHDIEALRQDIDVPPGMIDKWMRARDFEASFRDSLQRVYAYRKQVLAIFDGLVSNEQMRPRLQ